MSAIQSPEEMLDFVDENDAVIGQVSRTEAWQRGLPIRVVNAFLVNSAGLMWIPRRTPHKVMVPSCLDVSVGGHVAAGETYAAALARETREEINLDIALSEWCEVAYFSPFQTSLSAFMRVYIISTERTPIYNTDDFSESDWLEPFELARRIRGGEPAKGDLLELIQRIFLGGALNYD